MTALKKAGKTGKEALIKANRKLQRKYSPVVRKNINKTLKRADKTEYSYDEAFNNLGVAFSKLEKEFGFVVAARTRYYGDQGVYTLCGDEENDRVKVAKQEMTKAQFKAKHGFDVDDKFKSNFWKHGM